MRLTQNARQFPLHHCTQGSALLWKRERGNVQILSHSLLHHLQVQSLLHFQDKVSWCPLWSNIFGTPCRAIILLSYWRFKAIRHQFHCQRPSKEPLAIGRKGCIQRYSRKGCIQRYRVGNPANSRQRATLQHKRTFHPKPKIN